MVEQDPFTFDTSGEVVFPAENAMTGDLDRVCLDYRWPDLDAFTQGYIEALFASLERDFTGEPRMEVTEKPEGVGRLFLNVGFSDIAPETLAAIIADCARYLKLTPGANDRDMGAMFWNDRQAGKWLRVCFPPLTAYLGDDFKVRLS